MEEGVVPFAIHNKPAEKLKEKQVAEEEPVVLRVVFPIRLPLRSQAVMTAAVAHVR